ncbi:MAG: PA14 domain-containing protein [Ferruginibacter sp.]
MLNRLSTSCQKEIALSFIAMFFISGLNVLKAEIFRNSQARFFSGANLSYSHKTDNKFAPAANAYGKDYGDISNPQPKENGRAHKSASQAVRIVKLDKGEVGGPSQPEMNAFKSIGADNMVSPFSGDFSYNIPLMDVGGYPINMFYNSGITMDQESSWLGLGWNINPGTVTRNLRGLPDDFDGTDKVTKRQSFRPDKTWGVTTGADVKFTGFPFGGFGISTGLSFNNKLGVATNVGADASIDVMNYSAGPKTFGLVLGVNLDAGARSGASVSPSLSLHMQNESGKSGSLSGSVGVGYTYSSRLGLSSMHIDANASVSMSMHSASQTKDFGSSVGGSFNSTLSFTYPSIMPSITRRLTKSSFSLNTSLGIEYWWINPTFKLGGYYTETFIAPEDKETTHPAYGMLNFEKANDDPDALLDFNRANDGVYTPGSPGIGMPIYTYDVFSINGEGTGGSFRAYRGDIGHMRDANVVTKEQQGAIGMDIGLGNIVHGGTTLSYVYTPNEVGDWKTNNGTGDALSFHGNEGTVQGSYFKNPSEKTIPDAVFQASIANEDLVRLKLGDPHAPSPVLLPTLLRYDAGKNLIGEKLITAETRKIARDKRTQVISFLTAEEADRIGTNTKIYSYNATGTYENKVLIYNNCDADGIDSMYRDDEADHGTLIEKNSTTIVAEGFHKKNHISEIDVLGGDGKKYVYGLPVYNTRQVDVTFSVDYDQKKSEAKATYAVGDNTGGNTRGRDWIMDQQEMPAYTHSFLLTALLSPNYVDVTGNGLTDDDMGDGIKFNYSKYDDYKWRTPVGSKTASYSEGLKTDEKDDKAHYIYGEREQWYLYTVESKNMVARFYIKNDRKDGRAVLGEEGTLNNLGANGMRRLDHISLFSKADLAKYHDAAKPIKTVWFFQKSYKLCVNDPAADELGANVSKGYGKLTLDSIWITYNGNQKKPKSRYVFYYPNDNNPGYVFDNTDRWGNYKPREDNPLLANPPNPARPNIPNEDYPYSAQDETKANKNAAAWTMNKILLPSGAVINVDYESDSYAYVQNKKAACMYKFLGFGSNTVTLPATTDLNKIYMNDGTENDIVYVQVPNTVTSATQFMAKYLQDIDQLYLKLAVVMPSGSNLSGIAGSESIGVYADIKKDINNCGIMPYNPGIAWIRVEKLGTTHTPMLQESLQFLRQQLPGKAYTGYDVSENDGGTAIVATLAGILASIKAMVNGELEELILDKKCQEVALDQSFIKLSIPAGTKFGGGLRVKKITISDNWEKMASQLKSTYGQEYHYTTTEIVNGLPATISSGVAAWEPSIGGDENPFRGINRYVDHNKAGPYDFGAIELPLGESLYPAAMVGYSRVEVVSIHRDTVKNLPTRQVTEFYTNKDFPYKSVATELAGDANCKYDPPKIMQLLKIDLKKFVTLSQGFLVETNDMNGKEKSHATYTANNPDQPVSYTENFYNIKRETDSTYSFNHNFPTINNADGLVTNSIIGRDIELMTDFREHNTETFSTNTSVNFDLSLWGIYPIPTGMVLGMFTKERTLYRSAAVLKVVTHYGMIDSVRVLDKGSMVSTKNLVYDAETGNPLLTRTQNEHNNPVYNFNYPAHWAYSGMGPAYKNIDAVYPPDGTDNPQELNFVHGILQSGPQWPEANKLLDVLESGDELYVLADNNDDLTMVMPCDQDLQVSTTIITPWNTLKKKEENKIWAVNTAKAGNATAPKFVFMDAEGNPYNALRAHVRIVRSGKRNMLDQSVGSVTSLNNPIDPITHTLVFNQSTAIIQTAAATFKDHWRVDNSFYKVVEKVDNSIYATVKKAELYPIDYFNLWVHQDKDPDHTPNIEYKYEKVDHLHTHKWGNEHPGGGGDHEEYDGSRIFLLFDHNGLAANAVHYKSFLTLFSHTTANRNLDPNAHVFHTDGIDHLCNGTNAQSTGGAGDFEEVRAMKTNWFNTQDPLTWGTAYFLNNSDNNVTSETLIPPSQSGHEDYYFFNPTPTSYVNFRVNISNTVQQAATTILGQSKQIGIRINQLGDREDTHFAWQETTRSRCFWLTPSTCQSNKSSSGSPGDSSNLGIGTAPPPPPPTEGCELSPKIDYYYYIPGNTDTQDNPNLDQDLNKLLTLSTSIVNGTFCRSRFTERKSVNPYVEGIYGNWRVDSTYAYYGERIEGDVSSPNPIDTRKAGAIKDYKSFWKLASNTTSPITRNTEAGDVWVWNSAITQYNRKGYEIENTDPLGRFNSGLYGYNQQLPIAVANNARVREIMFDGFEDHNYETVLNCAYCKPHKNLNYSSDVSLKIDATEKHTGKYSLKLAPDEHIELQAPVTGIEEANRNYSFRLKDTINTIVSATLSTNKNGMGSQASYFNHLTGLEVPLEPGTGSGALLTQANQPIHLTHPGGAIQTDFFSVKWEAKLQAPKTGTYRFIGIADNCVRITLNGNVITDASAWVEGNNLHPNVVSSPVYMTMGTVYNLVVDYYDWWGGETFDLQWLATDGGNTIIPQAAIPTSVLYGPTATAGDMNTVNNATVYCIRLDSSNVRDNALTDTFSLLQNKKMLLSAWVKVNNGDCHCVSYNGSASITITYDGSNTAAVTMNPTGGLIEGWQRFESEFDVPATATSISVSLKNDSHNFPVFYDDVRILPFNANMKNFVYHPSNLRLMAELDENNYASFYEYDDDGTLTRVKKETIKGIKTITETRSATQKLIATDND